MNAKQAYQEYLTSDHWKWLRGERIRIANGICEGCQHPTARFEVHHVVYRHPWTLGRLDDVRALCPDCHEKRHATDRTDEMRAFRAIKNSLPHWNRKASKQRRRGRRNFFKKKAKFGWSF
jgi:hypothetical protein